MTYKVTHDIEYVGPDKQKILNPVKIEFYCEKYYCSIPVSEELVESTMRSQLTEKFTRRGYNLKSVTGDKDYGVIIYSRNV